MKKASKRRDPAVLKLLQQIAIVDTKPGLKRDLLLRYVNQCRERHSIAFLQWRLLYPTPFVQAEACEELIRATARRAKAKAESRIP